MRAEAEPGTAIAREPIGDRRDSGTDFERSLREGRERRRHAESAQAPPGAVPLQSLVGNAAPPPRLVDWKTPRPCLPEACTSSGSTPAIGDAGQEGFGPMQVPVLDVIGRSAGAGPRGRRGTGTGDEEAGSASEDGDDLQRCDPFGSPILRSGAPPLASPMNASTAEAPTPGPTRAALESALSTPLGAPGPSATAKWDVSLPHASGVPLEVRAGRADLSDGTSAWTLDIRSSGREMQPVLARSASRLSDRLEARSLRAHVRIEDEQKGDSQ